MPPTYLVSGTIRDDAGQTLSGASVVVGQLYSKWGPVFSATTGAEGRFSGRLPNGSHILSVTRPGFRALRREGVIVEGDNITIDATLQPGVIISGTVSEPGADRVDGVTIEIVSGPNAGSKTTSRASPFRGAYSFDYLAPGEMRLRASKPGYDVVEQSIDARINSTVDFALRMTYGSCLRSVGPLFFDDYRSSGGTEAIRVEANPGRQWSATSEVPWLQATPASQTGSAQIAVTVAPHPSGAVDSRRGALMIRCSASEAQAITFVQRPDCQVRLAATPSTPGTFDAGGGTGGLKVEVGVPGCLWHARSQVDWMHTVGVSSWRGTPPISELMFVVRPNQTGQLRSGQLLVGDTAWTVNQR